MSDFEDENHSPVLEYKWEPMGIDARPGTILSEMINFHGQKLFRVGLKNEARFSTLMFMTFGLKKMGLDDYAHVTVTGPDGSRLVMRLEKQDNRPPSVKIYSAKCIINATKVSGDLCVTFHVYINSCTEVPNYNFQRVDVLLGDQLWSAAVNRQGTDLELIAGGRRFPVHKFILVARSPGFATYFQANLQGQRPMSSSSIRLSEDVVDASTFEQFLKFIYTGELVGGVSHSLCLLAKVYQVDTLKRLCEKCLSQEGSSQNNFARLVNLLNTDGNNALETIPDPEADIDFKSDACIFTFSWVIPSSKIQKLDSFTSLESPLLSEGFGINSANEMFSAKISSDPQSQLSLLIHLPSDKVCLRVQEVNCILGSGEELLLQQMVTDGKSSIHQMFTVTNHSGSFGLENYSRHKRRAPFRIPFTVKLVSTVPTFSYRPRDLLYANHIWSAAAIAKKMTDVEVIVGLKSPRSFHAHRFILSARSPVFDAMLNGTFKEARTGVVRITDVDPDTFAHFLKFLYTGQLTIPGDDRNLKENLFALADRYEVVTLMNICRPAPGGQVDDELNVDSDLMMSLM